jgi:hypothetical protein
MKARQLNVDLDEIVRAMDDHSGGFGGWFLDTDTGKVEAVSYESLSLAEDGENEDEDGEEDGDTDTRAPTGWQREELELARRIVADNERFIRIPQGDSGEAYRVMEDFIPTVRDRRLREKLSVAIAGKGAFRRFKDVLLGHPDARQEWFAFEARVKRDWARDWLASLGIETTWQPPGAAPRPPEELP